MSLGDIDEASKKYLGTLNFEDKGKKGFDVLDLFQIFSELFGLKYEIGKPRISEKRKVISFLSPPNTKDSLDWASFSTMAGAKYCEKAVLTFFLSNSVNRKLKKVITR